MNRENKIEGNDYFKIFLKDFGGIIIFFVIIILGALFIGLAGTNEQKGAIKESPALTTSTDNNPLFQNVPKRSETYEFSLDVLHALNEYYYSTQNNITETSEIDEIMSASLDAIRYLDTGDNFIRDETNSKDKVVYLVANGIIKGSKKVKEANTEFINFLRAGNLYDSEYAAASFRSKQKEGYLLISTAAPQVAYLYFEFAKSENPSGPIPYKIPKEEITLILNEIERLFGEEVRDYQKYLQNPAGSYNAIIFSVNAIRNRLLPETYEQANTLIE